MSVALPFLFLLSLGVIVNEAVNAILGVSSGVQVFPPITFLLLLSMQIEESVGSYLVQRERAGAFARIREFVLILTAVYLLLALFRGGPLLRRLVPDPRTIARVSLFAAGWLLSAGIHSRLRVLETFHRIRGDHRGEALHHAIRQSTHVVGEAREGLLSIRRSANLYLGLIAVILIALWLVGLPPGGGAYLWYCVFCLGYVATRASINIFLDEMDFAADGLTLSLDRIRHRIGMAAALGGIAALVALLIAADRSILPFSLLLRFFAWIASLFQHVTARPIAVAPPHADQHSMLLLSRYLRQKPQGPPPAWLKTVWEALRVLGIVAAVGLVLLFLFGPLVSRDFAAFLKRLHPLKVLRSRIARFFRSLRRQIEAVGNLILRVFSGRAAAGLAALSDSKRTGIRTVFRPDRKKRRETDLVRRELIRVIEWGETHGNAYFNNLTAAEYAARLEERYPELEEGFEQIVGICNEAIYSQQTIGTERLHVLRRTVDRVLASY